MAIKVFFSFFPRFFFTVKFKKKTGQDVVVAKNSVNVNQSSRLMASVEC